MFQKTILLSCQDKNQKISGYCPSMTEPSSSSGIELPFDKEILEK